jgi:hypothetical protein
MVIQLVDDVPVLGIIVEVQLSPDERKRFVWPAYVANLRARIECPVCLLVVTADDAVARWAARRVELGGQNYFAPYVLSPSLVPKVTEAEAARANPELAVLSAMAHGESANTEESVRIATVAQMASAGLDDDRSKLYFDLIMSSLSEAARHALNQMDARNYEYRSDFARHYVAQGEMQGRAALIARQLTVRFGPLSAEAESKVRGSSIAELDAMGERLLTARTLREALGLPGSRGAEVMP